MSARNAIPTFFLLGEAPRPIGDRFAHVESLKERSRPSDWHIRPHAHDELSHVFLVRTGGGAMHADMKRFHFRAPAVLTVPCRCIHAFEFEPETSGFVATIGEAHLRRIVRQTPGLERLFDAPSVKTIEDDTALARDLSAVDDELGWNSAFSDAALQARLSVFLIETARALGAQGEGRGERNRRRAIAARFRRLLDAHFKEHWSVEAYAAALGVSPLGLRRACVDATGRSPSRLAKERIVLEAQRSLAYSNRGIAQIGFSLGYQDPAYFSRVFGRHVGLSPQAYRRRIAREGSGAP